MRLIRLHGIEQYPVDYNNWNSKNQPEAEKDASDEIPDAASSPLKNQFVLKKFAIKKA